MGKLDKVFDEIPNDIKLLKSKGLNCSFFAYYSASGKAHPNKMQDDKKTTKWGGQYCYADVPRFFRIYKNDFKVLPNRLKVWLHEPQVCRETEYQWLSMCKKVGWLPKYFNVPLVCERRFFDIPLLEQQTHKLYILLACTRYPREVPQIVAGSLWVKSVYPDLDFVNIVVTAHDKLASRGGHVFVPEMSSHTVNESKSARMRNYIIGFKKMMEDKTKRLIQDVLKDRTSYGVASYNCEHTIWSFAPKTQSTENVSLTKLLTEV